MTDHQLFAKVLGFLKQTIVYSNEEMARLDELKRWVRERLSQPEPRPIAWLSKCYNDDNEQIGYTLWDRDVGEGCFPVYTIDMSEKHVHESDKDRHEKGTSQENRQVAMRRTTRDEKIVNPGVYEVPLFDCPRCGHCCQQKEWVGLEDEEIYDYADKFLYQHGSNFGIKSFGKAIEAKLKEKNREHRG